MRVTTITGTWWRGCGRASPSPLAQQHIDALNRHSMENAGKLRKLLENARFATVVQGLKEQAGGRCAADPVPAAVRGGVRAADRLRECRQPDAGALQHPHEGTGHPLQPGRGARAAGGAIADRGDGAGGDRRRLRRAHGNGRRAPAGADRHRPIAARSEHRVDGSGAGVQRGGSGADRTGLRLRARSITWCGAISTPSSAPRSEPGPRKSGRCGRGARWWYARFRWRSCC